MGDTRIFSFKSLLSEPDFSDVSIKCEGRVFPCHRGILAKRSTVFERMLKTDMVEAQTGEVATHDIEEKTMEKLLEFIYTGEIDNMGDQLEMLLYAADYYEIQGLIQVCKNALSQEDVTPKNATKILLLAERHSLNELKKVNQDDKNIYIFTYIW